MLEAVLKWGDKLSETEEKTASTKVNLAIIDTDLTIRTLKKYPLSTNGRQILVTSGGVNHFMPVITNTSYLEFPTRKKYFLVGAKMYKRIYFAMNKAKKCVDFKTGEVSLPSPEEQEKAIGALIATKVGTEGIKIPIYLTILIALIFLMQLVVLRILGAF